MRTEKNELAQYIAQTFVKETALMQIAKEKSREIFKDRISLSSPEASLMAWILRCQGARRVVELGTLTGYSALWIASALPEGGELYTFEKEAHTAELAQSVFNERSAEDKAKVRIELLVGDAEINLGKIEGKGPFDAIFIDANKGSYFDYLIWAEKNLRKGGLLVADNTLLGGDVVTGVRTGKFTEKNIEVMQKFNSYLGEQRQFQSILIGTDEGLTVALKQ